MSNETYEAVALVTFIILSGLFLSLWMANFLRGIYYWIDDREYRKTRVLGIQVHPAEVYKDDTSWDWEDGLISIVILGASIFASAILSAIWFITIPLLILIAGAFILRAHKRTKKYVAELEEKANKE